MLKASVKISSPVLGNIKLQHVQSRKIHLPSTSKINTSSKSSINLQKTITLKQKFNNKNTNYRWSSTNTQTDSALEYKPVTQYTRFTPHDVPPEKYAQYVSTEGITNGVGMSAASALAIALLFLYMQSEEEERSGKKIANIEAIPDVASLHEADLAILLLALTEMGNIKSEHAPQVIKFSMGVLQHNTNPLIVEQAIEVLRKALIGPATATIPMAEVIQRVTTDALIQEIPIQVAAISLISDAALSSSTRAQVANPLVVDYAELLINHSEPIVVTKATHVLLSLARSEQVELLGGTVHTLWNLITRNTEDEAVGYAKEALSLINARKATSKNEEFKKTVDNQIRHANIHHLALDNIAGYKNTHWVAGWIGANLVTAAIAAGWGLVRWHTQLARSGYHIDTPTARKIVSMRIIPTVAASVALLNFVKLTGVDNPRNAGGVPEVPVIMFTGGVVTQLVPFCVAPAVVGFAWKKLLTRNDIVKDIDYQY